MTAWDLNAPNHRNKLMELVERIHFYGAKGLHGAHRHLPRGATPSPTAAASWAGVRAMRSPGSHGSIQK